MTANKSNIIDASKFYVLTRDLDFNSIFSYSNFNAKYSYNSEKNFYEPEEESETSKPIKELCTTGQGFIPIGLNYSSGITFKGKFDGQSFEIKNIYIKTSNCAALFGGAYKTTIKNLTIDGEIIGTGSTYASGILGSGYNITIDNCKNKATITNSGTGRRICCSHRNFWKWWDYNN